MGMFDTVVIEGLKLPKLSRDAQSYLDKSSATLPHDFQTKDLVNCLSTYTIDKSGQIFETEYKPTGKKVPYKSPFSGWVDNRSFLEKVYFKIKDKKLNYKYPKLKYVEERKPVKVKSKLTSTFDIYTNEEIGGRYIDVTYNIVANNGKVIKITLKESNIELEKDAKRRRSQQVKFQQKMDEDTVARNNLRAKWYYPILKEVYNPFIFFSTKIIQAICNFIIRQTYRWHGV